MDFETTMLGGAQRSWRPQPGDWMGLWMFMVYDG